MRGSLSSCLPESQAEMTTSGCYLEELEDHVCISKSGLGLHSAHTHPPPPPPPPTRTHTHTHTHKDSPAH
jgi:hypothetical protein